MNGSAGLAPRSSKPSNGINEPIIAEIREEEAYIAEVEQSGVAQMDAAHLVAATRRIDAIRGSVAEIRERSLFAVDSAQIYERFMGLAAEHEVTIDRVTPRGRQTQSTEDSSLTVASFDLAVRGGYEPIARFLGALDSVRGLVQPSRIVVGTVKSDGRTLVEAQVTCEALSVMLPESLAAMVEETSRVE